MNISRHFLLGRYTHSNSLIHRMDGRVKIFVLISLSISFFFISNLSDFIYPAALFLIAVILSGIGLRNIIRGMIPVFWLIIFSFIFHSLIPPRNMEYAVEISIRLLLLFLWASLMTATTPNIEIGKSVSWYLWPLKIFKVAPENVALTFSLSLRFFPIVLEEADSIMKAQKLRKEKMRLKKRLESFCTVFIIRVLKRAKNIEYGLINRNITEEKLKEINSFRNLGFMDLAAIALCTGYNVMVLL